MIILCVAVALIAFFTIVDRAFAFNYNLFDTTWSFERAIIKLADGRVIDCAVDSWQDYENSDQIQVKTEDGTTYLVHSVNCTLISE